jgi:hypothetical protein
VCVVANPSIFSIITALKDGEELNRIGLIQTLGSNVAFSGHRNEKKKQFFWR